MEYKQKCLNGRHPRILVTQKFILINNLALCRTQQEISEKMKETHGKFCDFQSEVFIDYLDSDHALPFLNEEYKNKVENEGFKFSEIYDTCETVQDMLDYMVFGWSKALDEKGISASRTIDKIGAWLWLLGRDDLYKLIHDPDLYATYGVPALIAVCGKLQIMVPEELIEFSKRDFDE